MKNPKHEIRSSKQTPRPKFETWAGGRASVLECGGQRSAPPLSADAEGVVAQTSSLPYRGFPIRRCLLECGGKPASAGATPLWVAGHWSQWLPAKRRRGGSAALPAQSKARRQTLALGVLSTALCLLSSVLCLPSSAQYALDWWTTDGGGGTSTGGVYAVTGTIGQADAGPVLSGGNFTLAGGFWSIVAAVQTPGAPYLTVFRTVTNTVVVSWPLAGAEGWVLEATNALPSLPAPWAVIQPPYETNGANLQFTEPAPVGSKFYRLRKP